MIVLDPSLVLSPYVDGILDDIDSSTFVFSAKLSSALKAKKGTAIQLIARGFTISPHLLVVVLNLFEAHEDWHDRGIKPPAQGNEAAFQAALFGRASEQIRQRVVEREERLTAERAASVVAETVTLGLTQSSMILALDSVSSLTWDILIDVLGGEAGCSICLHLAQPGPFETLPMSLETILPFQPRLIQIAAPPLVTLDHWTAQDFLEACRICAFTIEYVG